MPVTAPHDRRPDLITRLFLAHLRRRAERHGPRRPEHHEDQTTSPGEVSPELLARIRKTANQPSFPMPLSALPLKRVIELRVPGATELRPARLYLPHGTIPGVVLFLHGGGYVHCGLNSHHGICCRLARASGAAVLSFDYRLAPEHKFPAALEDCAAALRWLASEAWRWGGKIAVAGDSAGGALAAVLARHVRDENRLAAQQGKAKPFDLTMQVLIYPATHGQRDFPSRDQFAHGYFLTRGMMEWYALQYARTIPDVDHPDFSPGMTDDLTGLAPALIITAEFDPLRDEAMTYASALRRCGVPVRSLCIPGTIHAFLNFYAFMPKGRQVIRLAGKALRQAFRTSAGTPSADTSSCSSGSRSTM